MPVFLSNRSTELVEFMDMPDCDHEMLINTYRQFTVINALLSKWKSVYRQEIKPILRDTPNTTLLDIGFGGGDITLKIAQWAKEDGFDLNITAIDTDERAYNYVQKLEKPENVTFLHCSSTDLLENENTFDIIISNHVLHHLDAGELANLLAESEKLASRKVIFNDIMRSDVGYLLFTIFSKLFFRRSFISADGLISIKKSFTKSELTDVINDQWKVRSLFPYRLLLIHEKK